MRRILVVSTPAILEARNLASWITRERIPGVRIAPSKGEWGVFAPASHAERARRAFRKVVAANNPGSHRVVFKIRAHDPYTVMKKRRTFGRAVQIADMLVKGIVLKAAVLDPKGKVRFVAYKRTGRVASNPGMDALADAAVMMAARGARQYLDTHKLTADPAALTACLKSWVKIKFPEALKDAKDALAAGMGQIAEATFAATMRMAGIEAAKEAARPPGASTNSGKVRWYCVSVPPGRVYLKAASGRQAYDRVKLWVRKQLKSSAASITKVSLVTKLPAGMGSPGPGRHYDTVGRLWVEENRGASSNPHAQVPLELRGQAYASRFAGYLRKRGVRCSMKPVTDRPGWWAFFVRPSQLQKAEALEWDWMRVSDPVETKRMEIKGHAAFRRWRRRVQRRPHRRGERKEGYWRGGVLHPARSHRNPGEYHVEHKSAIMEVEWLLYGRYPTEEKARAAMERLMQSGHDEGMPDDYVARTTCDGRTVAQRFIKDWRKEKPRGRPRPYDNPRRRASRNARSYRRNGVMSSDEAWAAMQWLFKNDKVRYQIARRKTVDYLIERRGPDSPYGISSSDVNHTMVSLIVQGDITMPSGAPWRKRVRKNVSIESKWPRMTDRQRREALRIIGIQEDIAELWSDRSWDRLSSVVKTLLLRSWKHGGDTTKIRRVPVGAR